MIFFHIRSTFSTKHMISFDMNCTCIIVTYITHIHSHVYAIRHITEMFPKHNLHNKKKTLENSKKFLTIQVQTIMATFYVIFYCHDQIKEYTI